MGLSIVERTRNEDKDREVAEALRIFRRYCHLIMMFNELPHANNLSMRLHELIRAIDHTLEAVED